MASVRKRKKSPYWVACFSLPDGSRLQRSTETRDKFEALQIAHACEKAAREKATADAARRIIFDVVERIHGQRVSDESLSSYLDRWLARKKHEVSAGTHERYEGIVTSFDSLGALVLAAPISQLTPAQLSRWRDDVAARLSKKSVNAYTSVARQIFSDAVSPDHVLVKSPAEDLRRVKTSKLSPRRGFTMLEIPRILAHSLGEWHGMALLGLYSSQRLSDIASLHTSEIGADGWWRSDAGKTEAQIAVPLVPDFLAWLKDHAPATGYVFPQAKAVLDANAGKSNRLSDQFRKILVAAGIVAPRDHKKTEHGAGRGGRRATSEVSFHSLRHTTTTLLKSMGVSEVVVMAIVGHDSRATNRQYTHLPESVIQDAVLKLPSFANVIPLPLYPPS